MRLVKAVEWERAEEDKSLLLRGSELSAAESWLAGAKADADPPPTELQRTYLLRSRQANLRRQRRFAGTGLTVAAVAIALLIFALISRGQAVTAESTASSRVAAQSTNLLGTDPETSLLLSMKALDVSSTPEAMYAVRDALDHSTVRLALPTMRATGCYSTAAYNPGAPQILRTTGDGRLIAYDATSGRVQWDERLEGTADCVLTFDPTQHLAAVGAGNKVDLVNPATGSTLGTLGPSALRTAGSGGSHRHSRHGRPNRGEPDGHGNGGPDVGRPGRAVEPPNTVRSADSADGADGGRLVHLRWLRAPGRDRGGHLAADRFGDGRHRSAPDSGWCNRPHHGGGQPDGTHDGSRRFTSERRDDGHPVEHSHVDAGSEPRLVRPHQRRRPDVQPRRFAAGRRAGRRCRWRMGGRHPRRIGSASRTGLGDQFGLLQLERPAGPSHRDRRLRCLTRPPDPRAASLQTTTSLSPISVSWAADHVTSLLASSSGTCVPGCFAQSWSWPQGTPQSPHLLSADPKALVAGEGPDATVATPEADGYEWTVTIWALSPPHVIRTFHELPIGPMGVASDAFMNMTENGRYLELGLAGSNLKNPSLRTYDVATGAVVASTKFSTPSGCGVDGTAATNDGREYALVDFCGHVWIKKLDSQSRAITLDTGGRESAVAFNNAGTQVAVASWDGIAQVFDAQTGDALFELVGNPEGVTSIAYSPDDRYIVTTSANGDVQTWSPSDGRLLRTQQDPNDPFLTVFDPQGQASTWDQDNTLRVWNLCSGCQDPSALLGMARTRRRLPADGIGVRTVPSRVMTTVQSRRKGLGTRWIYSFFSSDSETGVPMSIDPPRPPTTLSDCSSSRLRSFSRSSTSFSTSSESMTPAPFWRNSPSIESEMPILSRPLRRDNNTGSIQPVKTGLGAPWTTADWGGGRPAVDDTDLRAW